jgi:micrococcal nuclease
MPRFLLPLLGAWLLVGCLRTTAFDAGVDASVDGGGYDPAMGNRFDGPISFDDDRVMRLDARMLGGGSSPCRAPLLGRVTFVDDGDTIRVDGVSEIGNFQVRMIGVDTPEVAHPPAPADCFGPEAAVYTADLDGRLVWLTFDADCTDAFDRDLAYVWIGGGPGDLWQRQLLRRGFARTLAIAPNTTYEGIFESDRAAAESAGLGLWSACP